MHVQDSDADFKPMAKDAETSFEAETMRPMQIIDLKQMPAQGDQPPSVKFLVMLSSTNLPNARRRKVWLQNLDKLGAKKLELLTRFRRNIVELTLTHQMKEFSESRLSALEGYLRANNIDLGPRTGEFQSSSIKVSRGPAEEPREAVRPAEPRRAARTPARGRQPRSPASSSESLRVRRDAEQRLDYFLNIQLSERILDLKKKYAKEQLLKSKAVVAELHKLAEEVRNVLGGVEEQLRR